MRQRLDVMVDGAERERVLSALMRRILRDMPEASVALVAAEMCRATVGVGKFAMPQPQPDPNLRNLRRKR